MTDSNPHIPDESPQNPDTKTQQEETPPTSSQSPKTLTLADQDPQSQSQSQSQTLPDPNPTQPSEHGDTVMQDPVQKPDDPEPDAHAAVTVTAAAAALSGSGRRGTPKRKKSDAKRTAQEKKCREKLQVLVETLKPIPFVPPKALDFSSHQSLLQRLGLWEFVHLEYDPVVRSDLLAQLIASYVPASRCSYVNGIRIKLSRADLGRALKLPKKNAGSSVTEGKEEGGETVDLAESIGFIEELVSNWMMLHDEMFIMTSDVMGQLNLIKTGKLEKVDWAGLIWSMMDKELKAPQLTDCYYASHMQQLIKAQHQELLEEPEAAQEEEEEEEGEEVGGKDDGEEAEVKDEEDEEAAATATVTEKVTDAATATATTTVEDVVDESGDVKMSGVDEGGRDGELEEHNIELSLGQDNAERVEVGKDVVGGVQIMDFDQPKVEDSGLWLMDQKNNVEEPFLRPCQTSDVKGDECGEAKGVEGEEGQEQEEEEEDAEDDEHDGGFSLSPKCIPMEGMPSGPGGLVQAMSAVQMPFTSGIDLRDNPVGDFLSPRDDPHMISGSSLFGNGHKRELDLDNHNSHHALNGSNKRLRGDSPWNSKPADFETCMEHIEHWMGKARMMYAAKEQACDESLTNQQLLLNELQKRDEMIEQYHKAKMDESHKRQVEMYRLEKELFMMTGLVEGYRKALKETQKAFADYRTRCPQAEEPLYKDVPGSGGLVLSVMELEKERLRKEEEERIKLRELSRDFERKLREIESTWFDKLGDYAGSVESLANRLQAIEEQVKHLKEVKAKCNVAAPPERTPTVEDQNVEDQNVEEQDAL
ncbi:uncharacterized protein LOC107478058 [Arachis duranensis]|uniref:Uncharacterized protein LOC107478058 n=1 Tax=Arachis duranensis TaxID=130453 RepID=A0A6P4CLM4_ARADU|nr:uncharacterized protein LOC107478058 [Arachis duranensis]